MIVVIGLRSDKTVRHTVQRALEKSMAIGFVDISEFLRSGSLELRLSHPRQFRITIRDIEIDLFAEEVTGVYLRPILTEIAGCDPVRIGTKFNALYTALHELSPERTINHPIHDLSNSNRILHLSILADCGFPIGSTLSTSDPLAAASFFAAERDLVYKSNSSIKTVTSALTTEDLERLVDVKYCPIVLQRRVFGSDVRIHYLDGQLFPLEVVSDSVDYRYDKSSKRTVLQSVPDFIEKSIHEYAKRSRLRFIGFDFKIESDSNRWLCLEANPMPGYDSYDKAASGAISDLLLHQLEYTSELNRTEA